MRARFLIAALMIQLGCMASAHASSSGVADRLIAQAAEKHLARSAFWLKLVDYKPELLNPHKFKSDVLTPSFFLAKDGRRQPDEELAATIRALLAPVGPDPNKHAQCRFPARYIWLKRQLAWPKHVLHVECKRYEAWRQHGNVRSVSLILASGYLSNAASFYGHLLLKFNSSANPTDENLLDTSLNYGATDIGHDSGFAYVIKGLFGGYHSTFTHVKFFNHTHHYAAIQLRDVWEYNLNLTPGQVQMIVAHSWELLGQYNRYYFLKQNCAYRMAELLNVVIDEPLLPPSKFWATPIDVFQRLARAKVDGHPLVKSVKRIPSVQNTFRDDFFNLTPQQRAQVREYVRKPAPDVQNLISGHSTAAQIQLLRTLIQYYTFVEAKQKPPTDDVKSRLNSLLLARLEKPAEKTPVAPAAAATPPHLGQRSTLAQVSYLYNDKLGSGVEYRFRGAYNDLLSLVPGTLPNSQLEMADVKLVQRDGQLSLRLLQIIRVLTLNVSQTGLPFDGGKAWGFGVGLKSRELTCDSCLVGFVDGSFGKAFRLTRDIIAFGLATGRTTVFNNDGSYIQVGANAGFLLGHSKRWRASLEGGLWQQVDGRQRSLPFGRFECRLGSSPRWNVHLGVTYQDTLETSMSFGFYW